jgi:predicted nuclease of predicted toxin-antitoxin system
MKLFLDQGLPRSALDHLRRSGIDSNHVGELGMAKATDQEILSYARQSDAVIVSLDSDFHALLAQSNATTPSVIRIREEGLRPEELAALLSVILNAASNELAAGAVVSATRSRYRIRRLPLPS